MSDDITQIILDELREHRKESNDRHVAIDKRVRKVENWQAEANGKITIIGTVGVAVGGIVTWLTDVFRH